MHCALARRTVMHRAVADDGEVRREPRVLQLQYRGSIQDGRLKVKRRFLLTCCARRAAFIACPQWISCAPSLRYFRRP